MEYRRYLGFHQLHYNMKESIVSKKSALGSFVYFLWSIYTRGIAKEFNIVGKKPCNVIKSVLSVPSSESKDIYE